LVTRELGASALLAPIASFVTFDGLLCRTATGEAIPGTVASGVQSAREGRKTGGISHWANG